MRDLDAKVLLNTNYIKGSFVICFKFILKFAGLRLKKTHQIKGRSCPALGKDVVYLLREEIFEHASA